MHVYNSKTRYENPKMQDNKTVTKHDEYHAIKQLIYVRQSKIVCNLD